MKLVLVKLRLWLVAVHALVDRRHCCCLSVCLNVSIPDFFLKCGAITIANLGICYTLKLSMPRRPCLCQRSILVQWPLVGLRIAKNSFILANCLWSITEAIPDSWQMLMHCWYVWDDVGIWVCCYELCSKVLQSEEFSIQKRPLYHHIIKYH